jgi:hypothetical protein
LGPWEMAGLAGHQRMKSVSHLFIMVWEMAMAAVEQDVLPVA